MRKVNRRHAFPWVPDLLKTVVAVVPCTRFTVKLPTVDPNMWYQKDIWHVAGLFELR